jgi:hypothetical protein
MGEQSDFLFVLDVVDGWPPVSVECLAFASRKDGYELLIAPLFVKGLAVGDLIRFTADDEGRVFEWSHVSKSPNSTIWILRLKGPSDALVGALASLRRLGCDTGSLVSQGVHTVNVPGAVDLAQVETVLDSLSSEEFAVAYPALRHDDN